MTKQIQTYQRIRYGYTLTDDGAIIPEPTEQLVMNEIARLTKQGKTSNEIAAALNADGHRTRSGAEWQGVDIRHKWKQQRRFSSPAE